MAEENIVTNITANADFGNLISSLNKVTASLFNLQNQAGATNKALSNQISVVNRQFADVLRSTGQFTTHFVSVGSEVDKFGKSLDSGRLKLKDYFGAYQQHVKTTNGLIRGLAKQQVQMQNAIVQPLAKNAQGLMQYNVHVATGLDTIKNKSAIAVQELKIMNKVMQEGANQLINWGKNTQWAGRQLTVGLTVPMAAFGKAAADAFKTADQELVRLTKVYGGLAQTSASDLGKIRKEVAATAKDLAGSMGASFNETLALSADIAATGKTGNELLGSIRETTRLSVLGEVDRQEAMKATLAIQSTFKQNTDELSQSINFLNAVENQTSTTLADLVEAIPKAGPVVKGLGGSIKDLALYLTAMKEGGINAAEGANALKSGLASLINPTKVAQGMFMDLGINLKSIVEKNAGDLTGTILELQSSLDKLNPLQKQRALEQLFGKFQFARMNALFANLGKQGSQTLQVLDLMKASSTDLANIAGQELSQVTESASGRYRRALESLKADLAAVGDQFLTINTNIIKFFDKILQFVGNLPDPIKKILGFAGAFAALAGPLIMLTGVLGNFFGYIVKGIFHLKALAKGGEGFKLLTPEIIAASKAGEYASQTFYDDAKAAAILNQALKDLNVQYSALANTAGSKAISIKPVLNAMAAETAGGGARVVDPTNPNVGKVNTRSSSHMNPRDPNNPATIFGLVPNSQDVNRLIGRNPQAYMSERLPDYEGVTSVKGVSTGIVASEAARHHAMMATLGMQTEAEVEALKKTIATGGAVSSELIATFDDILPIMTNVTENAARQTASIVAELKAGTLTVESARAQIIQLNAQIEAMLGSAATEFAGARGRTIDLTKVPMLNQPVVTATGKSNMRELFKKNRIRQVIDALGRATKTKTFGAPYSTETTIPKRFADGGSVVPGHGSSDTVPAMLTPGEFVVNKSATQQYLPLLQAINGSKQSKGPGYANGGRAFSLEDNVQGIGPKVSGLSGDEIRAAGFKFRGNNSQYTIKGTAGLYIGDVTDPAIIEKYPNIARGRSYISKESINSNLNTGAIPGEILAAAIESSGSTNRGSSEQFLRSMYQNGVITQQQFEQSSNAIYDKYIKYLKRPGVINDANNPYWMFADREIQKSLGSNPELIDMWGQYSSSIGAHTGTKGSVSGKSGPSTSHLMQTVTRSDGTKIRIGKVRGTAGALFAHASHPQPLVKKLMSAGLRIGKIKFRNQGGIIGYNRGGLVGSALQSLLHSPINKLSQLKNYLNARSMVKKGMYHGSYGENTPALEGRNVLDSAISRDKFYGMGFYSTSSPKEAERYSEGYNTTTDGGFGTVNQIMNLPKGQYIDFRKKNLKWQNMQLYRALGGKDYRYAGEDLGPILRQLGIKGAIIPRVSAGKTSDKEQDLAQWLAWADPSGVITKEILGKLPKGRIPGRAKGGPVNAGQPYMVGEEGPELFVPRNNGGIIPGYNKGGIVAAYKAGREYQNANIAIGQATSSAAGMVDPSKIQSVGFGAMMAGQMGGSALPKGMGSMLQFAGIAASVFPKTTANILNMGKALMSAETRTAAFAGGLQKIQKLGFLAGRAVSIAMANPAITAATVGVMGALYAWKRYTKAIEDDKKVQLESFAISKKGAQEAGISYLNLADTIKTATKNAEMLEVKRAAAYNELTPGGAPGLNLTIKGLQDAKAQAKKQAPTLVEGFNKADSDQVLRMAQNLKAQFIAGGKSITQATEMVYGLIAASNKASMAIQILGNKGFQSIVDKSTAADFMLKSFKKSLDEISNIKSDTFAGQIDTIIGALDSSARSLIGTRDANGDIITQTQAIAIQYDKIKNSAAANQKITVAGLEKLKETRPELAAILNSSDTIGGIYAKWRLELAGVTGDLQNLSSEQAQAMADIEQSLTDVITKSSEVGQKGLLGQLATMQNRYKNQAKSLQDQANAISKDTQANIKKEIALIEKKIAAIAKEADARIKALQKQQNTESTKIQIQKEQLAYQDALARGDQVAASQAQLNIQKLVGEMQTSSAIEAIQKTAQVQTDKLNAEKEAKQSSADAAEKAAAARIAALQEASAKASQKASATSTFLSSAQGIVSQFANVRAQYKNDYGNKDYAKAVAGLQADLNTAIAKAIEDGLSASDLGKFNTKNIGKDLASTADAALAQAQAITGGKTLSDLYDLISGKDSSVQTSIKPTVITSKTATTGAPAGSYVKLHELKKYGVKPIGATRANPQGTYIGATFIAEDGKKYKVTADAGYLGFAVSAISKAEGGPVFGAGTGTSDSIPAMLSNGEYVINAKAVRAAGIPMLDRINKMAVGGLATRYDIPKMSSSRMNFAEGGIASSNNALYNINVTLNGTNLNPNDVAQAISKEMKMREMMNGRNILVSNGR